MMLQENKVYYLKEDEKKKTVYKDFNLEENENGGLCIFAIKLNCGKNVIEARNAISALSDTLKIRAVHNGKEEDITLHRIIGRTLANIVSDDAIYYYDSVEYGVFYFRVITPIGNTKIYTSKDNEETVIALFEPYNISTFEQACLHKDSPFFFVGYNTY